MIMEDVEAIREKIGIDQLLIQVAEEAGELVQACTKVIRAKAGLTPVSEAEAMAMLVEECADVVLMVDIISDTLFTSAQMRDYFDTYARKQERFRERVIGGAEP